MALGPAGPLHHPPGVLTPRRESYGHGRLRPPPRPLLLPPRRSPRCKSRPTTTAQSLWELLSYGLRLPMATRRLHLQSWMPSVTMRNCSSLIPSRVILMSIGSESSRLNRRAIPQCVTSLSAGRRPCHPTVGRATLRKSIPPFRASRNWLVTDDYTRPTTTSSSSSVTRHRRRRRLTSLAQWGSGGSSLRVERRAYSHLRPPTHAPLDHASLPFDGFLPPWRHAHTAHAEAVLLVDRHECMHPVVASPLREVPSKENPAADCLLANHLNASPGRSWRRHQCRSLRPSSGHAARQHLHLADHRSFQSSGRYVPRHFRLVYR